MASTRDTKVTRNADRQGVKQRHLTTAEIDAQIPAARARDAAARKVGMRAISAHYDATKKRVTMELSNGYLIGVPVQSVAELAGATDPQLAMVEVSPAGSGLHWEALDMDLSVPTLILSAIPATERMREMGRAAGCATSAAKAKASRTNGAKGGRPRKAMLA